MSIGLIFLMSLAVVAAALITLIRVVGLRWVLRHATAVDVIFTIVICVVLAGTLTGVLIGIVAGLVMAGVLSVLKWLDRTVSLARARAVRPVNPEAENWCPGGSAGAL